VPGPTEFPFTTYNEHLPQVPDWFDAEKCRLPVGWNPKHYIRPTSAFHWVAMISARMETLKLMQNGASVSEVEKAFLTGYLTSCVCEEDVPTPDSYELSPSYGVSIIAEELMDNMEDSLFSNGLPLMIDLNASDKQLKESFSEMLRLIRKEMHKDINLRRKGLTQVTDADLHDWFSKRLVQLMDITLWSELTKQKFTQKDKYDFVYGDLDLNKGAKD